MDEVEEVCYSAALFKRGRNKFSKRTGKQKMDAISLCSWQNEEREFTFLLRRER
jgi:hypothetical protein